MARFLRRCETCHWIEPQSFELFVVEERFATGCTEVSLSKGQERLVARLPVPVKVQADMSFPLQALSGNRNQFGIGGAERLLDHLVDGIFEACFLKSHFLAECAEQLHIRAALAERLNCLI